MDHEDKLEVIAIINQYMESYEFQEKMRQILVSFGVIEAAAEDE